MKKLLNCSAFVAVLAMVSMGQAQAACGGGGFHPPAKSTVEAEKPNVTTVPAAYVTVSGTTLDVTHFEAVSSQLGLTKNQSKEISNAKSDISDENKRLLKAQSKAQRKLDNCDGNCDDAKRDLERINGALKNYNVNGEFESRLRLILRPNQTAIYFHS